MLDFIPSFISHMLGYYLLRALFGNPPKITLKQLLIYLALSFYFNYYLIYYVSEVGIGTLLLIWIVPMILPILIHILSIYLPRRRARQFINSDSTKPIKLTPKKITLVKREKMTLLILGGVVLTLLSLIVILGNRELFDWIMTAILGLSFAYVVTTYIKLASIDEQKIIVIKGKARPTVLEYTLDSNTLVQDYGQLLNTNTSFVDYVGRVLVKDASIQGPSWHFLFKTPDDLYTNPILKPSEEVVYLEVASQLNYIYDAKITLWINHNQLLKMKKNKK